MYESSLQELIDALGQLPGVGPKSAQRIAFHILSCSKEEAEVLANALVKVKEKINFCSLCGNITEQEVCLICSDSKRNETVICVVEEAKDINAIEKTSAFHGKYHVLGGVIDPINGIGPDQLRIRELINRISDPNIKEIIIATNPNIEGEATATYLSRTIATMGVAVTRLASGLPVGGDLEYADEVTLGRALSGRLRVDS